MLKRLSTAPYLLWSILLIVVPLVMVLGYSLFKMGPRGPEFSLDGFTKFTDPLYLKVLGLSVWIALQSTVLCLVIGYPLAMIMAGLSPSAQRTAMTMIILPMWMNFLLRTYAWIPILGRNGLLNGLLATIGIPPLNLLFNEGAVLLGMVYNFLPFMVLPIFTVLIRMDRSVIEAAQDLGANRLHVFWRVILPLSLPGVVSGIMMVFMPAVSTFVISDLLGGSQVNLVGNLIKDQFLSVYDWNFGASISVVLMALILVSMWILGKTDKNGSGVSFF